MIALPKLTASPKSVIPKSRAKSLIRNRLEAVKKPELHATEIKTKKFTKLDPESNQDKEIKALMKRFNTGSDKYHSAALSEDGSTLVFTQDGKTTLRENFGGASAGARFASKALSWFGTKKDLASKKYDEYFNNHKAQNQEVSMVMEPKSHLFKGLSTNHYHGLAIFHKNKDTGKFEQTALSIIDSYKYIYDEHSKTKEIPENVKAHKELFDEAYAIDKTIPMGKMPGSFSELYNDISEGLYAAQGFSFLTIPGQVHKTLTANSKDLNYIELPWHRVQQMADKHWRVMAEKKAFDAEKLISDAKDREFYESKIADSDYSNITIIRPIAEAQKPLDDFIGFMENWSQMYSGKTIRAKDKNDQKLVHLAQAISQRYIDEYNSEYLAA